MSVDMELIDMELIDMELIDMELIDMELIYMELIDMLRASFDKEEHERNRYDSLIDALSELGCFVSMVDGRPCMFESYGTVIDFHAASKAMDVFGWDRAASAVRVLRYCDFTPLALVLASYIERQAARKELS